MAGMVRSSLIPPALALVVAWGCAGRIARPELPSGSPAVPERIRVQATERGRIVVRSVAFETYVQTTIISEFAPPAGETALVQRMLEVQAIVSRTYAVAHLGRHARDGFDVCATTHCQLYEPERLTSSRWAATAAAATARTAHAVLWHDGRVARSVFHADCGGHTSAAADVWGGDGLPYLAARTDGGEASNAHTSWDYTIQSDRLLQALNSDARTEVGTRLAGIEISRRDRSGRAAEIRLRGRREVVVPGDVLRQVLSRAFGARSIRSTLFDVRRERTAFRFVGRGFGHGVGLCQAGALARLRSGWQPLRVLSYYFPGTQVVAAPEILPR